MNVGGGGNREVLPLVPRSRVAAACGEDQPTRGRANRPDRVSVLAHLATSRRSIAARSQQSRALIDTHQSRHPVDQRQHLPLRSGQDILPADQRPTRHEALLRAEEGSLLARLRVRRLPEPVLHLQLERNLLLATAPADFLASLRGMLRA